MKALAVGYSRVIAMPEAPQKRYKLTAAGAARGRRARDDLGELSNLFALGGHAMGVAEVCRVARETAAELAIGVAARRYCLGALEAAAQKERLGHADHAERLVQEAITHGFLEKTDTPETAQEQAEKRSSVQRMLRQIRESAHHSAGIHMPNCE